MIRTWFNLLKHEIRDVYLLLFKPTQTLMLIGLWTHICRSLQNILNETWTTEQREWKSQLTEQWQAGLSKQSISRQTGPHKKSFWSHFTSISKSPAYWLSLEVHSRLFFLTMLGNGALGLWSVFVSVRFCRRFREMCGCNWSILTASEEQGLYS